MNLPDRRESRGPSDDPYDPRDIILGIFCDFAEKDVDTLFRYFDHVGFDARVVTDAGDLPAAWLGHYRLKRGHYDVDRACNDLATWPPIASRIFELLREEKQKLAK